MLRRALWFDLEGRQSYKKSKVTRERRVKHWVCQSRWLDKVASEFPVSLVIFCLWRSLLD